MHKARFIIKTHTLCGQNSESLIYGLHQMARAVTLNLKHKKTKALIINLKPNN
jgi:hypothetical protein